MKRGVLVVAAGLLGVTVLVRVTPQVLTAEVAIERADAIVVLAGAGAYLERARAAAELYRAGRAPLVALSDDGVKGGWSQSERRNPYFVERASWELQRLGVPSAAILPLPGVRGSGTFDELTGVCVSARQHRWRSMLVVTSWYHTRRVTWILGRIAGQLRYGVHAAASLDPADSTDAWWTSVHGWQTVAAEYAKNTWYRIRYASLWNGSSRPGSDALRSVAAAKGT